MARTDKALTSYGGFAAFASFLKRSGVIEKLVDTCPIVRTSNNATSVRDIVLSILLTCINEGSRFRHVRFIQNDDTIKKMFKLDRRVCRDDAIRRFMEEIDSDAGKKWLVRADIGFCSDSILRELENSDGMPYYIFKLKKTSRVLEAIHKVTEEQWLGSKSFGALTITEKHIQLSTWDKPRRVMLGRRLISKRTPEESCTLFGECSFGYCAFVTNLIEQQSEAWQIAETYQDRADCENIFDELKNQWGLAGFCSQQQNVTELAARFTLLS